MFLLFLFGTLNAAFFPGGDVLVLFAITGLVLIPFRKAKTGVLAAAALFFLMQPLEIFYAVRMFLDPAWTPPVLLNDAHYPAVKAAVESGNFFQMVWVNITSGQQASLFWAADAGRMLQAPGLFLTGVILQRCACFPDTEKNRALWANVFVIGTLAAFAFYIAHRMAPVPAPVTTIFTMWHNVAFTGVMVAAFVMLYQTERFRALTNGLRFYGRMSLTNYVSQSIIGALLFFPFALNLAPRVGMAGSFLMGLAVMVLQIAFCQVWFKTCKLGPLETLWHKATWVESGKQS